MLPYNFPRMGMHFAYLDKSHTSKCRSRDHPGLRH